MKKIFKAASGLLLTSLLVMPVAANADMTEGNWESTMTIKMEDMPFPMPPMTVKATQCLTKKDFVPTSSKKGEDCTVKESRISGDKGSWKIQCNGSDGSSTYSEGEITYKGDSYSGKMNMKTTAKGGEVMRQSVSMTGKRLGACKK